jgi:hypothetical protein
LKQKPVKRLKLLISGSSKLKDRLKLFYCPSCNSFFTEFGIDSIKTNFIKLINRDSNIRYPVALTNIFSDPRKYLSVVYPDNDIYLKL